MINLLDFNFVKLTAWLETLNEPRFRAVQLLQWIHQRGEIDFNQMSDLSKSFRSRLHDLAAITLPTIAYDHLSKDGTRKWLFRLADNNCIETVYIPETERGTLCVSSQVGCALNCSFCSTGKQGFNRDLTTAEIIGQVWSAVRMLAQDGKTHDRHITNIVMMGMGEPLLNLDNLLPALDLMMDDHAYGLSKRRVTVSTSGVLPGLLTLKEHSDCALAVSLHAPNDELRDQLVPINKKYPLAKLMDACRHYFKSDSRRRILMEYVMLDGINDTSGHAKQLIKLLHGIPAKVNLIPFNPFPQTSYQCSKPEVMSKFQQQIMNANIMATIRKTRGQDIDGACGQLVGSVQRRMKNNLR